MLIDTHAHISFPDFSGELENVLERARQADVAAIIEVGTSIESSQKSLDVSSKHNMVYSAVGIHPQDASEENIERFDEIKKLAASKKVVALGETGLDYFHMKAPKEQQIELFKKHLDLAKEINLPLIIHVRDAFDDALKVLEEYKNSGLRGVFHCFAGGKDFLKQVLDFGFYVSFTGIITFPKANLAREVLAAAPLDKLLLETDCPFLTPVPFRGKRNEPAYVKYTAQKVCEIFNKSLAEIVEVTTDNAKELFKITL